MKCFIYARQSVGSADADDSLSIEVQVNECLKMAKEKRFEVIDIFREANHSGRLYPTGYEMISNMDMVYQKWLNETKKTGQSRDKLGGMLNRLNEVDLIICYDFTRLHRSLNGSFLGTLISQKLSSAKIKLFTIKEGEIDFSKFSDNLIASLTSQINSEQLNIQREKSKKSVKRLKDSGEWNIQCFKSFGYKSTGRKREVEKDELKAKLVRMAFEMFIGGNKYYTILRKINEIYYPERGKALMKTHLVRILHNPIYCGYYRDSQGELIKAKPNEGLEIITLDMWKTAQKMFENRQSFPVRAKKNWLPISGKVFCGKCGHSIHALIVNRGHVDYRCMSYSKLGLSKENSCRVSIGWERYNDDAGGMLECIYSLCAIYFIDKMISSSRSDEKDVEEISIKIENINAKMKKVNDLFLEDLMDESSFRDAMKKLKMNKKTLEDDLDKLKMSMENGYAKEDFLSDMLMINKMSLDDEDAYQALNYSINKITLFNDKMIVDTKIGELELPIKVMHKRNKALPNVYSAYSMDEYKEMIIYKYGDLNDEDFSKCVHPLLSNEHLEIHYIE